MIKTMMGLAVMIMELFMALVRFNPLKKNNWFTATPKSPQMAILPKSFLAGNSQEKR